MSRISYYLLFGFIWVITLLPFWALYVVSDLLFVVLYYVTCYRRNVTHANLKNAFPDKPDDEIHRIAKVFYRRLSDQILEAFKLVHMSKKQMQNRFHYKNPEILDKLYQKNKSVIVLAGHFGTWQWIISLPTVTKHKVLAVYKPTSFKELPGIYYYVSKNYGTIPVPMKEIYREIVKCKSQNELSISFLLADQRPLPKNIKYWTRFLNQDTPTLTGFERIAKKTEQAVVYMEINWKRRGYYDVHFRKICDNPKKFKDYDITEAFFRELEQSIRKRPEFWLWTHKRWKITR
jgi:KDO2-lipid IV(A) lauroyltransferase